MQTAIAIEIPAVPMCQLSLWEQGALLSQGHASWNPFSPGIWVGILTQSIPAMQEAPFPSSGLLHTLK